MEQVNKLTLEQRIRSHMLRGGFVMIRTYTRQTIYSPKHIDWFKAPKAASDTGVFVRSGRNYVYVFPQYVHFSR